MRFKLENGLHNDSESDFGLKESEWWIEFSSLPFQWIDSKTWGKLHGIDRDAGK
jgi:hypothetical protein